MRRGATLAESCANFMLMEIGATHAEFVRLMSAGGVLVRDRSSDPGCDGCVRITIGTREQMREAAEVLSRTLETSVQNVRRKR